ncbi:peptidase S8 [Nocardiopsis sp. CNR-923]|uniref:S8 family serine peptidase n=1 Tax=Nocardiopsis sp. CNR-923 TaxID=1904965 RepID=UPI000965ED09|nr:S8 family serine peptidase [Nocardiopsis sp. CNR-923]OLT29717.1 peptidase S8 [Nocardiopsis sp. CNR-923]
MLGGNNRNRTRKRRFGTGVVCAAVAVLALVSAPAAADGLPDLRPEQWGLVSIGAPEVWALTQGLSTTVALPGVTVPEDHPDLVDNVSVDTEFGANDGDFDEGTALAALVASHGHGRDAEGGVLGVAPEARLLVLPTDDALPDAVRRAVDEGVQIVLLPDVSVIAEPPAQNGATATDGNGANGADVDGLGAATEAATEAGVLVVGPAGGDDPNVLSVAGVDADGALIPGSPAPDAIELTAPGADLSASAPDGGEAQVTGARYAAAMVAGAAALLSSEYPQLDGDRLRQVLVDGSQEGPNGLPTLHVPTANGLAAGVAEENPLIDQDLLDRADEGPRVPVWAWFVSVGAVLVLGVLLAVVWVRRSTADPYGVREERQQEEETIAAERGAERAEEPARPGRRGGRRRKPRGR